MDSITHTLIGVGIGTVASSQLNLNGNEELIIMGAAILASNVQDFDVITKLFGNVSFINNHRGASHMLRWVSPIALLISIIFTVLFKIDLGIVFTVSIISLLLHIGLDSLNSYGTKLTEKSWVRIGVIHTFDLVLILILSFSTLLKVIDINVFNYSFILIAIYLSVRLFTQLRIKRLIKSQCNPVRGLIMAKGNSFTWNVVLEFDGKYLVFDYAFGKKLKVDNIQKESINPTLLNSIENSEVISAFKGLSPIYIVKTVEGNDEVTVKYTDLRYRYKGNYYFNAIYKYNHKKNVTNSSIGWNLKHAESL
ncbi:metal-dependent hydrolase [Mycoplasmatota bacterium WC44]